LPRWQFTLRCWRRRLAGDATDDQFLSEISSQGITMDRDTAISQAHQVCDLLALQHQIGPQYNQFAYAAIHNYCPDVYPPGMMPR
jgi:Protein of unknown function (DUF732)